MDEQKKSDCMAQKKEKTCEWVNGEKKKKKKNERASKRSCEQKNEWRIKLYLKNLGGALHENGMKRRRYTHSHHALQRMPLICFHRCAVQFGCGLKWRVIDHRKTSEEDQIKFVDQWTKCCQHHGQYPWCIRAKMHSQLTRIAFSALPNIAYSFETFNEIASARRSPLSKKRKKNPHESILLVIITIATLAGFAPENIVIVASINDIKSSFWFYGLY